MGLDPEPEHLCGHCPHDDCGAGCPITDKCPRAGAVLNDHDDGGAGRLDHDNDFTHQRNLGTRPHRGVVPG